MTLTEMFGACLEAACERSPLKHHEISAKSGYSENYLRKLRRGQGKQTPLYVVETMSDALGVSVGALLGLEPLP